MVTAILLWLWLWLWLWLGAVTLNWVGDYHAHLTQANAGHYMRTNWFGVAVSNCFDRLTPSLESSPISIPVNTG